jgi:hypothetical protein
MVIRSLSAMQAIFGLFGLKAVRQGVSQRTLARNFSQDFLLMENG